MTDPLRSRFEAAVHEHQQAVFNLARRMTGSDHAAEEIAQEAFLRLWRAMGRGVEPGPATRAYLYRTAMNLGRDRGRRARCELAGGCAAAPHPPEEPEAKMLRRELEWKVREAVLALPTAYRRVVVLRHYHGLTYEEIGAILRWPVSLVRNRLFRARRRLRQLLHGVWKEAGES